MRTNLKKFDVQDLTYWQFVLTDDAQLDSYAPFIVKDVGEYRVEWVAEDLNENWESGWETEVFDTLDEARAFLSSLP